MDELLAWCAAVDLPKPSVRLAAAGDLAQATVTVGNYAATERDEVPTNAMDAAAFELLRFLRHLVQTAVCPQ